MTWVLVGVPLAAPGIPRSRRFAGSRPLTLREGGVLWWFPAFAGMTEGLAQK